jgi:ribonuclease HII
LLSFETELWDQGFQYVAGIDEAGRGPLAGPVVAGAVIFAREQKLIPEINDSKKLSEKARVLALDIIKESALAIGIGVISPEKIDEVNILQATYLAMKDAISELSQPPDFVLIDGKRGPQINLPHEMLIKGDSRSMSIAAASIVAKVTRDEMMYKEHAKYPQYGFAQHKGYPTKAHIQAIRDHGQISIHRKSFHPRGLE